LLNISKFKKDLILVFSLIFRKRFLRKEKEEYCIKEKPEGKSNKFYE